MPLLLTPSFEKILEQSSADIFVIDRKRAQTQDIRPLQIAILNLMPNKEETETQLLRLLANQPLQVEVDLLRTVSYTPSHIDLNRWYSSYKTLDDAKDRKYDGLIVTGAPLEMIPYDQVTYWKELEEIFEFARTNVYSALFICWAAQAALHYYYNVDAAVLKDKISGVFSFAKNPHTVLMKGFDDVFSMPHSRYSRVDSEQLESLKDLDILASSEETGVALAASPDLRLIFDFGHFEYDRLTLHREYLRDLDRGKQPEPPAHYYEDPEHPDAGKVLKSWSSAASQFFSNWTNYVIYQKTPYDISQIHTKSVAKFGGTSLSDAGQFRKVKEIISSAPERNVIVVSAPGKRNPLDEKVTDSLIAIADAQAQAAQLETILETLREQKAHILERMESKQNLIAERFRDICEELNISQAVREEIEATLDSLATSADPNYIISRGEYLNARIMADFLGYRFVDAKELIAFSSEGKVDIQESNARIRARIAPNDRVVVPGFYGSEGDQIRIFKRGGSDYTGSILSNALNTEIFENWTDVNGVMSANPNVDKNAKNIPKLTYEGLRQILDEGAEIYQKEALEPVQLKHIPIHIRNTNQPGAAGTWVGVDEAE